MDSENHSASSLVLKYAKYLRSWTFSRRQLLCPTYILQQDNWAQGHLQELFPTTPNPDALAILQLLSKNTHF